MWQLRTNQAAVIRRSTGEQRASRSWHHVAAACSAPTRQRHRGSVQDPAASSAARPSSADTVQSSERSEEREHRRTQPHTHHQRLDYPNNLIRAHTNALSITKLHPHSQNIRDFPDVIESDRVRTQEWLGFVLGFVLGRTWTPVCVDSSVSSRYVFGQLLL